MFESYPTPPPPRIGLLARSKADGALKLNIGMIRAGAAALRGWNIEEEEPEAVAVEVFYRMLNVRGLNG